MSLDYATTMAVATGHVLGMCIHIYNGPIVLDKSKAAVLASNGNSNLGVSRQIAVDQSNVAH